MSRFSVTSRFNEPSLVNPQPAAFRLTSNREPTWMEATFGAAGYGALDIGSSVLRRASKLIPGDEDFLQSSGNYLRDLRDQHPNWAPMHVESAWDLLTTPKALAGVTASNAAYFGGLLGLAATGAGVTALGAPATAGAAVTGIGGALFTYAVEGQSAYDEAIANGATRYQAEVTANTVGPISAAIEMLQFTRVLRFAGKGKNALIKKAVGAAERRLANLSKVGGDSLTADAVRLVAMEGLQEAIQGTVHESGHFLVYGKPFEEGFIDRRLQEFIGVAPSSLLFGGAGRALPRSKMKDILTGKDTAIVNGEPFDSPQRDEIKNEIIKSASSTAEINAVMSLLDSRANTYARQNGVSPKDFYSNTFALQKELPANATDVLFQTRDQVGDFITSAIDLTFDQEVKDTFNANGDSINGALLKKILQAKGVSQFQQDFSGLTKLTQLENVNYDTFVKTIDDTSSIFFDSIVTGDPRVEAAQKQFDMLKKQRDELFQLVEEASAVDDPATMEVILEKVAETQEQTRSVSNTIFKAPPQDVGISLPGKKESTSSAFIKFSEGLANINFETREDSLGRKTLLLKNLVFDESQKSDIKQAEGEEVKTLKDRAFNVILNMARSEGYEQIAFASGESLSQNVALDPKEIERQNTLPEEFLAFVNKKNKNVKLSEAELDFNPANNYELDQVVGKFLIRDESKTVEVFDSAEQAQAFINEKNKQKPIRFHSLELTSNVKDTTELETLYQGTKGSVTFLEDGRAIIRALEKPDISTMVEEIGHVLRRQLVGEDLNTVETFYGVKDSQWDVPHEERFAEDFQTYVMEGKAPATGLQNAFRILKESLVSIYKVVIGENRSKVSRELRAVFDRLLHEDSSPITKVRAELDELDVQKADVQKAIKNKQKENLEKVKQNLQLSLFQDDRAIAQRLAKSIEIDKDLNEELQRVDRLILKKEAELEKAQKENFSTDESEIDDAIALDVTAKQIADLESGELVAQSRFMGYWRDTLGSWFNQAAPLLKTKSGRLLAQRIKDADAWQRSVQGPLFVEGYEAYKHLDIHSKVKTSKDLAFLKQVDESGATNFRRLLDPNGVLDPIDLESLNLPPEQIERLRNFRDSLWSIFRSVQEEGTNIGVIRKMEDGLRILAKPSKTGKIPRLATDDLWRAVESGSGPIYDAVLKQTEMLNPGLTRKTIIKELRGWLSEAAVRKNGTVEDSRKIRFMPDEVVVDGKRIAIMHTDPFIFITRGIELSMNRLALIKFFGQDGMLDKVITKDLRVFLNKVGGSSHFTKDELQKILSKRLSDHGLDSEIASKMTLKDLQAYADSQGIAKESGREDIIDRLLRIDTKKLSKEQTDAVFAFAKKVGGVDIYTGKKNKKGKPIRRPVDEVYNDIILREGFNPVNAIDRLRKAYSAEGGRTEDFDNILRVWQNLPYNGKWVPRNPATRLAKTTSALVGALQTSLSVAPNVVQTAALVPSYGGFARFAKAWQDVMLSPDFTRTEAMTAGAFRETLNHWMLERGYYPEGIARNIRQAIGTGTGLRFVSDMNSSIAARTGVLMIRDFKKHGAHGADVRKLKKLGLSDQEIDLAKKGKFAKATESKIISNMVAKTQFTTEIKPFRGSIENRPYARMLFSYWNYTAGATRAMMDTFGDIAALPKAVKAKDGAQIYGTIRSTVSMLVGSMGAGMAGSLLREVLKGLPAEAPAPDEDEWEAMVNRAISGMAEVQLLGATQRMLDPFKYGDGVMERIILGTMPQVSFVKDLLKNILGMGKFGRFGLFERTKGATISSTPIASSTRRWIEEIAYPEVIEYEQTATVARKFGENTLGREDFIRGDVQINPKYYHIFEAVKRGEMDAAVSEAKKYYQKELSDPEFIRKAIERGRNPLDVAVDNLKQSLMARAPGNFTELDTIKFITSLKTEDQKRAAKVLLRYRQRVLLVAPK